MSHSPFSCTSYVIICCKHQRHVSSFLSCTVRFPFVSVFNLPGICFLRRSTDFKGVTLKARPTAAGGGGGWGACRSPCLRSLTRYRSVLLLLFLSSRSSKSPPLLVKHPTLRAFPSCFGPHGVIVSSASIASPLLMSCRYLLVGELSRCIGPKGVMTPADISCFPSLYLS